MTADDLLKVYFADRDIGPDDYPYLWHNPSFILEYANAERPHFLEQELTRNETIARMGELLALARDETHAQERLL